MPAYKIKDRLLPYRILAYLMFGDHPWLERSNFDSVTIQTGEASRVFRMRSAAFWEAIYWLKSQGLVLDIIKQPKRGSAVIKLRRPEKL